MRVQSAGLGGRVWLVVPSQKNLFEHRPVALLVQVAAALGAVLLVALRLVQAVGGARSHLRVLGWEGWGAGRR